VAIIQFNTGWPQVQVIPTNPNHFHAILFLGHHLSVSSILIFPTFTALAIAFGAYARQKKFLPFESATGFAGLVILFLCYARTAWLAIPIGIILIFSRSLKTKTFLAGLMGLIALIAVGSQTPAMKERIQNSMGIQDRFRLWEASLDYFKHRPITGIGWLATQEYSGFYFKEKDPEHYKEYFWGHAHSNFFEMLGGAGILGFLTFIAFMVYTIRFAHRTSRIAAEQGDEYLSDFSWGILTALVLLHFNGLTNVTFWEGKVIHQQMIGLGLLFIVRILLRKKAERNNASVL
jgi:O-antigen ligase